MVGAFAQFQTFVIYKAEAKEGRLVLRSDSLAPNAVVAVKDVERGNRPTQKRFMSFEILLIITLH